MYQGTPLGDRFATLPYAARKESVKKPRSQLDAAYCLSFPAIFHKNHAKHSPNLSVMSYHRRDSNTNLFSSVFLRSYETLLRHTSHLHSPPSPNFRAQIHSLPILQILYMRAEKPASQQAYSFSRCVLSYFFLPSYRDDRPQKREDSSLSAKVCA